MGSCSCLPVCGIYDRSYSRSSLHLQVTEIIGQMGAGYWLISPLVGVMYAGVKPRIWGLSLVAASHLKTLAVIHFIEPVACSVVRWYWPLRISETPCLASGLAVFTGRCTSFAFASFVQC